MVNLVLSRVLKGVVKELVSSVALVRRLQMARAWALLLSTRVRCAERLTKRFFDLDP